MTSGRSRANLGNCDVVTGLPDRTLFLTRLAEALARPNDGTQAVLFIDIDDFKSVNDRLGHRGGDALLALLAERLVGCLGSEDIAARFGGDEFLVLLEGAVSHGDVIEVAERILRALRRPVTIEHHELRVTASAGIALRSPLHSWPTEILREADVALYQAKRAGRGRAVLFDASMNVRAADRLDLEDDLARAVERDQLFLVYQPEVDLRSGRIVGAEALLRWRHHERGVLQPADVIPMAEETGLILAIGAWVLEEACHQAQAWQSGRDGAPLHISVNVSARQLSQSGLVDDIARILRESGLAPGNLRLEITESVLVQYTESSSRVFEELRALGVQLALDDFGTGYSSLTYLRQFPLDVLKLDQSFVRELDREEKAKSIVGAVVTLARALDIEVTAEGVETHPQAERLLELGCERAQGYLFAEPQPAGSFAELLQRASLHPDTR